MKKKEFKKTLISPKVRLLLLIHLYGVKDESNYLAQLADKLDYSEGSIKSNLISDLLNKNLIESLIIDNESPPYRTTKEAKKFLDPIFFVRIMGIMFAIFVFAMFFELFYYYIDRTVLLIQLWLPAAIIGFGLLVSVLILYPNLLLRFGKIAYPSSD
jgi:hypothetical protein